jgi:hypothetical protein
VLEYRVKSTRGTQHPKLSMGAVTLSGVRTGTCLINPRRNVTPGRKPLSKAASRNSSKNQTALETLYSTCHADAHNLLNQVIVQLLGDTFQTLSFILREDVLGHSGLAGMRERASRIEGQSSIRSSPGQGTRVQIIVPAARAYQ